MKTTRQKYEGECAQCMSCKEWTDILEPCCGGKMIYEGGIISYDSIMEQIEDEESVEL